MLSFQSGRYWRKLEQLLQTQNPPDCCRFDLPFIWFSYFIFASPDWLKPVAICLETGFLLVKDCVESTNSLARNDHYLFSPSWKLRSARRAR